MTASPAARATLLFTLHTINRQNFRADATGRLWDFAFFIYKLPVFSQFFLSFSPFFFIIITLLSLARPHRGGSQLRELPGVDLVWETQPRSQLALRDNFLLFVFQLRGCDLVRETSGGPTGALGNFLF